MASDTKPKKPPEKERLRPEKAWTDALIEAWDQAVLVARQKKKSLIEETGVGRTTVKRVREAGASSVSYGALEQVRRAINSVLGEAAIPPPYFAVRDAREHAWALLGRRLAERDPEELEALLIEFATHLDLKDREANAKEGSEQSRARITEILMGEGRPRPQKRRH